MEALEHLLTHSRRHFLTPTIPHRSPFLGFQRFFSSSSNQETLNPQPPQIKPVSYSLKPKPQEQPPPQTPNPPSNDTTVPPTVELLPGRELRGQRLSPGPPGNDNTAAGRDWTREDFRYVKQGPPGISPVSYPVRVAPLPDDKVVSADVGGGEGEEEKKVVPVRMRRILRVEDEKVLPFPSVIKVEKKKSKVILDLQEAIREVKANAKAKFDETIEAHVNLGVDPRRGDQMVRGAATLPHGTGKAIRIAVFAEGAAAEEAREAGADVIGGDELIEEIKKGGGKLNFDKCIATPLYMPRLGKIARILGPRGLMPNPKLGSVTSDVAAAVKAAKRGRIDFKIDKTAIVHVGIGKVSFTEDSLRENIGAFVNALLIAKPVGLKKTSKYAGYVNSFSLSSTMGPGFPVSIQSLSMAADHYNKLQLK